MSEIVTNIKTYYRVFLMGSVFEKCLKKSADQQKRKQEKEPAHKRKSKEERRSGEKEVNRGTLEAALDGPQNPLDRKTR